MQERDVYTELGLSKVKQAELFAAIDLADDLLGQARCGLKMNSDQTDSLALLIKDAERVITEIRMLSDIPIWSEDVKREAMYAVTLLIVNAQTTCRYFRISWGAAVDGVLYAWSISAKSEELVRQLAIRDKTKGSKRDE